MDEQLDNLIADLVLASQRVGFAAGKSASETCAEIPARGDAEKRLVEYIEAKDRDNTALRARAERMEKALKRLYDACMQADADDGLDDRVNGEILDEARAALKVE